MPGGLAAAVRTLDGREAGRRGAGALPQGADGRRRAARAGPVEDPSDGRRPAPVHRGRRGQRGASSNPRHPAGCRPDQASSCRRPVAAGPAACFAVGLRHVARAAPNPVRGSVERRQAASPANEPGRAQGHSPDAASTDPGDLPGPRGCPADEDDLTSPAITPPDPVPDLDWDPGRARRFADQAVELWEEFLKRLPSLPVAGPWNTEQVAAGVGRPVPEEGPTGDEPLGYLRSLAFEWSMYPGHPRFMAYITGSGTVPGAPADLLAAGLNMNLGGWRLSPSGTEVELALIRWFADQFGLPASAGGLLVSGGAMANFVALKVARDAQASWDIRSRGVAAGPPLMIYASEEVHVTTERAADMMGLGIEAVRKIPIGHDYRMRSEALREAIQADREAGAVPFAVVGTAGTVATGVIDPLQEIGRICE